MRLPLVACVLVAGMFIATPARADLIVVNASDYALGTNLSDVLFPGLSMATVSQSGGDTFSPIFSPVFVTPAAPNPLELALNGTSGIFDYVGCRAGSPIAPPCHYSVLELRFDNPTDLVLVIGRYFSDAPFLVAYDLLDNPIAVYGLQFPGFPPGSPIGFTAIHTMVAGTGQTDLTLARAERDIARVVFAGDNAVSPTQISYQVPEPTTLALVALGLLGGLRTLRTRTKRTH